MSELIETIEKTDELPPVVVWLLKGDKYLHEDSLKNRNSLLGVGTLLYVCVFVLNEFVWHFTPNTGMGALKFLLGYPIILGTSAGGILFITRRLLFGANTRRPNPAVGMPNRTVVRLDYQNVIPPYRATKWLTKRLAVYIDLLCTFIMIAVGGWAIATAISMPYFLMQK